MQTGTDMDSNEEEKQALNLRSKKHGQASTSTDKGFNLVLCILGKPLPNISLLCLRTI